MLVLEIVIYIVLQLQLITDANDIGTGHFNYWFANG